MTAWPAPFTAAEEHVGIELAGGARVLFTTRRVGVSTGPFASLNLSRTVHDEPAAVEANRDRVVAATGVPRERFAAGYQVHGTTVRRLPAPPDPDAPLKHADGQATNLPGLALSVLVADCLPVAVAGEGGVAMLHSGWRGLAAGVLQEGVRALRELGVTGRLEAAIGPGAGPCCYEVGEEVHAAFGDEGRHGRNLDLKALASARLADAGVDEVHDLGACTICGDEGLWFSHRRDRGVTGRMSGVAWRPS